jgi:hypothetical protein
VIPGTSPTQVGTSLPGGAVCGADQRRLGRGRGAVLMTSAPPGRPTAARQLGRRCRRRASLRSSALLRDDGQHPPVTPDRLHTTPVAGPALARREATTTIDRPISAASVATPSPTTPPAQRGADPPPRPDRAKRARGATLGAQAHQASCRSATSSTDGCGSSSHRPTASWWVTSSRQAGHGTTTSTSLLGTRTQAAESPPSPVQVQSPLNASRSGNTSSRWSSPPDLDVVRRVSGRIGGTLTRQPIRCPAGWGHGRR